MADDLGDAGGGVHSKSCYGCIYAEPSNYFCESNDANNRALGRVVRTSITSSVGRQGEIRLEELMKKLTFLC